MNSTHGTVLRVLVVDDEELARTRLSGLVNECPEPRSRVDGEAANAMQALVWLEQHACDVVLLDVRMPGRDGMQLAAQLQHREHAPAVVFVTAHAEHALKAFDLEAVDYLTKPVRRERLQAALKRVAQRLAMASVGPASTAAPEPVVVVSDRGRVVRVPVSQVLYLRAELKYVTLRTRAGEHLVEEPLVALEREFAERFVRIHRNCLVARAAIRGFERSGGSVEEPSWSVVLEGIETRLAVSRRQWPVLKELVAERPE